MAKQLLKVFGLYLVAGAACKAGEELWENVLKGPVGKYAKVIINKIPGKKPN